MSVYSQHLCRLAELNDDRDPLQAFDEDLSEAITKWNEDGDIIIVGVDYNGDVRSDATAEFFNNLGLREVILERHGMSAPETYADGSKPIDGIFVSYSVDIAAGGYLAFGEMSETDHRGLWIDIHKRDIFGSWARIVRAPARRLAVGHLRAEKKFRKRLEGNLRRNKALSRARKNRSGAVYPSAQGADQEFERLDKIMVESRNNAKKKCRKIRNGGIEWTPEVKIAYRTNALCTAMIRRRSFKKVSSRKIDRLCKAIGDNSPKYMSMTDLERRQREAKRKWRALRKNDDARRSRFFERIAQQKAAAGNTSAATEIRKKRQEEVQWATARRLANVTGKRKRQTTTVFRSRQFDAAGQEVEPKVLETREEQVDAVLTEYEKRLRLAQNRGLMIPPLVYDFGYLGVGDYSQQVLESTYVPPPGTPEATRKWFEQLSYRDRDNPTWAPELTFDEFQHCWSRVRSRTAPGYSGLYANQFKSTMCNSYIAQFDHEMACYPFQTGYSPARWRIGLDAVIPKKIGNNFIEDSRTILLFELDANVNNKILAKKTMRCAEEKGTLSPEQYGSRKDLSSAEQALNKRLIFDITMQDRRTLVDSAIDLRSCYDLIGHSAASLSMQSQGAPIAPVVSMFTTLQNMEHHCVTSHGVSAESFGGSVWTLPYNPPPMGGGQGNGSGPCLWATTSTPCFEAMRKQGYGASFCSPISEEYVDVLGTAFVDDTNLDESPDDPELSVQEVVRRAQEGIDLFTGCISATGGEVRPDKSWWYALAVLWRQGVWSFDYSDNGLTMWVTDGSGRRREIQRMKPDEAQELLGVWMAPDGNNVKAVREMTAKAQKWADQVRTGLIRRSDVWLSLLTQISKTLEYPLTALALTERECAAIESPIRKQALDLCGIKKGLPHSVVDGPLGSHGIGRRRLYHSWAYQHVAVLLKHGQRQSVTGKLLRNSIERHQLEAGTQDPVLSSSFADYGQYATRTWVKSTWRFLSTYDVRVDLHHTTPKPRREHDESIMSSFVRAGVSQPLLRRANRCRLFLQALTVADIATGDGRAIRRDAWGGVPDHHLNLRRFNWAPQGRPGAQDWRAWREALNMALLRPRGTTGDIDPPLRTTLGRWFPETDTPWKWFLHRTRNVLYEWTGFRWKLWRPAGRSSRRCKRQRWVPGDERVAAPLTGDLLRTTVLHRGSDRGIWTTGRAETITTAEDQRPRNLLERLRQGPPSRIWATEACLVEDNGERFAEAIRAGTAIAVSDGSFKDKFGTAACIFQDESGAGRFVVLNVAPGGPDDQGAYRSELSGLYGIVCTLEQVCIEHSITQGAVTIGCDGEEALLRSVVYKRPVDSTYSDFDLISSIRTKIAGLPITVTGHWVEGHQDDLLHHRLDRWAQLNVWCDALAKRHWARMAPVAADIQWEVEGEMPSIWLGQIKISRDLKSSLYNWCEGRRARDYWVKKRRIPEASAPHVDWSVVAQATRGMGGLSQILWKAKHLTGRQPWGANMAKWGFWRTATCPLCKNADEDAAHIIQCPTVTKVWTRAVLPLQNWFRQTRTERDVSDVIIDGITSFQRNQLPSIDRATLEPAIRATAEEQDALGWRNFLDGFLTQRWRTTMQARFVAGGRRTTGRRWTSSLMRHLWQLSRSLWDLRNELAHEGRDSLAQQAVDDLDSEIAEQFRRGREDMPGRLTRHLFRGTLQRLLSKAVPIKRAWLFSVISARERQLRRRYGDQAPSLVHSRRIMMNWVRRRPSVRSRLRSPIRRQAGNANGPDQREPD